MYCDTFVEWHLATQVVYCIAAVMILAAEILARSQICCHEEREKRNYASIGIIILASGMYSTNRIRGDRRRDCRSVDRL